jgi:hypothetical protein
MYVQGPKIALFSQAIWTTGDVYYYLHMLLSLYTYVVFFR